MSGTGLYLYAVMRGSEAAAVAAPPIAGGVDFAVLRAGDVAVLASPLPAEPPRRTRRNLLAHARVLEVAMEGRSVLPMRFGVVADDAEAVRRSLAPRLDDLRRLLDRFDGLAEFGLRVAWPREAAMRALAEARPDLAARHAALSSRGASAHYALIDLGREVADALAARRARAQRSLLARLAPLAEDHAVGAPESDVEALRAEILLARGSEGAFLAAVEAAAAAIDFAPGSPAEIRWVGPSPVYTFATMQLDGPAPGPAQAG